MEGKARKYAGFIDPNVLLVGISALLFACKGTLIKFLYAQGAAVADVMLLRMLFSLPVYAWVLIARLPEARGIFGVRQWFGVCLVGVAGYYLASYLDLLGLQTVSPGLERVILYTYPVFVVLLSTLVMRKVVSMYLCLCVAVIYLGLLLVFYADIRAQPAGALSEIGSGAVYVLLSAITFAIYVVGSDHYMRTFSSALFTAVAMIAASLAMVLHYGVTSAYTGLMHLPAAVYGWCAVTALVFTVLPSFMMSAGVRQIGSAKAGAVGMIGPVATVIVAGLALGEPVTLLQLTGLGLVMLGVHRLHRL